MVRPRAAATCGLSPGGSYTLLIMVVLSLPSPFHGADKVLGNGLALAALWYFGGLLWRLKKGTAGVRPVEDFVD